MARTVMAGGRRGNESSIATLGPIQQMAVELVIKGRGKLGHLTGATKKPLEDDPAFQIGRGENGYHGEQRIGRRVRCDHFNKLGATKAILAAAWKNLPIGGLDRVMEGAFKLQQMQEQPLKGKNLQPLKYRARNKWTWLYRLLNRS
ncbi:hypothetical protein CK203_034344 [Vitis vinifera]|uniref:Uncharacterized protein n=1 Tax=Vitis vinifera TaxID=29760 RepID=A0A438INT6_VITVI|nr:hypothetical protein CK203_034344 [Vitis vinifera]